MKNLKNLEEEVMNFSYMIGDFLIWPKNASNIENSIKLIEKWNLEEDIIKTSNFFNNFELISQINNSKYESKFITNYNEITSLLKEVFENCKKNQKVYYKDLIEIAKKVIETYKKYKIDSISYITTYQSTETCYNIIHSINTAILTVAIAYFINLNNYKTIEICIAALIHKIGFLFIPKSITEKKGKLTDKELDIIKKYPLISYKIISSNDFPKTISLIILNHKENIDGSGYPQGIKNKNTNIEANIIGATSAYIAITLDRSYKKSLNPGVSLIEIVKEVDKKFDKRIIKLIINVLSKYPLGSIVELNNGSIAKVVQINEEDLNSPYLNYLIKNKNFIKKEDRVFFKSIPKSKTAIKKILIQEEIEDIKTKYKIEEKDLKD